MAKKNEIVHDGRIVEITPDFTTVEIIASSACSGCHAKGLCGMSEEQEKIIMLPTSGFDDYKVGDQVKVMTKMSMGLKAVWISYVIPLAVLMILILSLSPVLKMSTCAVWPLLPVSRYIILASGSSGTGCQTNLYFISRKNNI